MTVTDQEVVDFFSLSGGVLMIGSKSTPSLKIVKTPNCPLIK